MHPHHFEDFPWQSPESSDQNQTTAYGFLDTSAAGAHCQHIWKVLLAFYDVTVITVFPLKVGIKLRTQRVKCPSTNWSCKAQKCLGDEIKWAMSCKKWNYPKHIFTKMGRRGPATSAAWSSSPRWPWWCQRARAKEGGGGAQQLAERNRVGRGDVEEEKGERERGGGIKKRKKILWCGSHLW